MVRYFAVLLMFISVNAWAIDTFDAATGLLTIDAVVVNGVQFNNVVVKLKDIDVVSVGSSAPYGAVSDTCSGSNITTTNFNAITLGMTLDQVNQTIGCKYDRGGTQTTSTYIVREWINPYGGTIMVWFDSSGNIVTPLMSGADFKFGYSLH